MAKKLARKKKEEPKTPAERLGSVIKSCRKVMRKDKGLNGDLDRLPLLTWVMFLKFLDDMEQIEESRAKMRREKYRPTIESPYRWRDWAAKENGITGPELIAFINQEEATRPDGTKGAGLFTYLSGLHNGPTSRKRVIASVFSRLTNRMQSGYLLRDVINYVNGIHFESQDELFTLGHLYESMLREMRDAAGDSGEFYTPRPVVRFMVEATDPQLGELVLDPACGTGGFLAETFSHISRQVNKVQDRKTLQQKSIFGGEAKPLPYLLCQMNLLLHGLEAPQIDPENSLRFSLNDIGDKDRVDVIVTNPPFGGEEERGILSNFPENKQTTETALLFLQLIMRKLKRGPKPGRAAVVVPESVMGDAGVAQRIRQELVDEFNLHSIIRLPKGVFEPYSDIQTNLLFFDRSGATEGIWYYQHEVPPERRSMRNPCYTRTFPLRFEELTPILTWWHKRAENEVAWYVPKADIAAASYSLDSRNPRLFETECTGPAAIASAIMKPLKRASDSLETLASLAEKIEPLLGNDEKRFSLGSLLQRSRSEAEVDSDTEYKQITVKLYGKGIVLRKVLPGSEIRTRPQFVAEAGQLIMSRIDARNGAFGIVPEELAGGLVTQDFPLFDIDESVIEPAFLALLLRSEQFAAACKRSSRGTTNRKRLKEDLFLAETVPVPELDAQRQIIDLVTAAQTAVADILASASIAEDAVPSIANYVFE